MPDYRLFRLDGANRIMGPAIEISKPDDNAAIVEAIETDHAHQLEIWSGSRFVSRVDPSASRGGAAGV